MYVKGSIPELTMNVIKNARCLYYNAHFACLYILMLLLMSDTVVLIETTNKSTNSLQRRGEDVEPGFL